MELFMRTVGGGKKLFTLMAAMEGRRRMDPGGGESCVEKRQRLIREKKCLQISSGKRRKGVSVGGWFGLFIVYPSGWVRPPGPALCCLASVSVDISSTHTLKAILHRGSLISMRFFFKLYIFLLTFATYGTGTRDLTI